MIHQNDVTSQDAFIKTQIIETIVEILRNRIRNLPTHTVTQKQKKPGTLLVLKTLLYL